MDPEVIIAKAMSAGYIAAFAASLPLRASLQASDEGSRTAIPGRTSLKAAPGGAKVAFGSSNSITGATSDSRSLWCKGKATAPTCQQALNRSDGFVPVGRLPGDHITFGDSHFEQSSCKLSRQAGHRLAVKGD